MTWYRDQRAEPQADGDPGTEPYPRLLSVEQDEMIHRLTQRLAALEESVAGILALLERHE